MSLVSILFYNGGIAQLVEHLCKNSIFQILTNTILEKQSVSSSILDSPTLSYLQKLYYIGSIPIFAIHWAD